MVEIAMIRMSGLEAHSGESETQLLGRDAAKGGRIVLVHHSEHVGSREPLPFLISFRMTEVSMKQTSIVTPFVAETSSISVKTPLCLDVLPAQ